MNTNNILILLIIIKFFMVIYQNNKFVSEDGNLEFRFKENEKALKSDINSLSSRISQIGRELESKYEILDFQFKENEKALKSDIHSLSFIISQIEQEFVRFQLQTELNIEKLEQYGIDDNYFLKTLINKNEKSNKILVNSIEKLNLDISSKIFKQNYVFQIDSKYGQVNHTIMGPYQPGLLKLSLDVNLTLKNNFGYISAYFIPEIKPSENHYVMNILSNNTKNFEDYNIISCSSYGKIFKDTKFVNCLHYDENGKCLKYDRDPMYYFNNIKGNWMGSLKDVPIDTLCSPFNKTVFSFDCQGNNILVPDSPHAFFTPKINKIEIYNQTLENTNNNFRGTYLIDTLSYPEFYIDFYTNFPRDNSLIYEIKLSIEYLLKY